MRATSTLILELTQDQKKLKELIQNNAIKDAEEFLSEKQVDPNFIVCIYFDLCDEYPKHRYGSIPLIFFSQSHDAIILLLKYHANPYMKASYIEFQPHLKHEEKGEYSFIEHLVQEGNFSLLIALLRDPLFVIENNDINSSILRIFKFKPDNLKKNQLEAVKLLIQASTNLQESSTNYHCNGCYYSPLSLALNELTYKDSKDKNSVIVQSSWIPFLLENNLQLTKDLTNSSYFSSYESDNKKLFENVFQVTKLQKYFDSIVAFQLLQLAMIDKHSLLNLLTMDILCLIMRNIIDQRIVNFNIGADMYHLIYQDIHLINQMKTFKNLYSLLNEYEPVYKIHDFTQKYGHLSPVTFFAKAKQHQLNNPIGLVARVLKLKDKYPQNFSLQNRKLKSEVVDYLFENRGFFSSKDKKDLLKEVNSHIARGLKQ